MANFVKDQIIFRGDGKFRLVRVQANVATLENLMTAEYSNHTEADLLEEYVRGYLRTVNSKQYQRPPGSSTTGTTQKAASAQHEQVCLETRRRMDYLERLDRAGAFEGQRSALRKAIHEVAADLTDPKPPHETTVYRWRRRFGIALRDIRALLSHTWRRGGAGQSRLDPVVEGVVQEKIESVYLSNKRGSTEEVHNAVLLEIQRLNATRVESEWLKVPALRTIQRRVEGLDAYERMVARCGEREAQRQFADQFCARKTSRILEIVEIDHTPLDIMYTDARGTVIDRPYITVVLDRYSRCVLGFCISSAGHGVHAVFEALRHAMMPKCYLPERFPELPVEWPCCGWPERVLMDNGRELHAAAVVDALMNLGVICEYAASRSPNDKPHIERFLKSLNYGLIHKLPGTTLAKIHQRIGFKAEDEACITFEQLNEIIHIWIISVYHLRPHRGLNGRAPLDVWKESASVFPPMLKCNAEDLSIEFGDYRECAVQHYGIDLNTFQYSSPELFALRRMLPAKHKVHVKAPFENAGLIWVWHPVEHKYFPAYNKDDRFNNLTIEQAHTLKHVFAHSDAHQRTRASGEETIREKSNKAMQSKKYQTRRQGARQAHITSKTSNRPQLPPLEQQPDIASEPLPSDGDELYDFEFDTFEVEVNRDN
ncbi:DDE-type integrase/transposase/recombinase [Burkholderia ubonensis]|uniref:DDE-type integrase/transposase/recombinase n=1 Tax=Burkholderia ubonensis TaxID=101571 RepID=UPI000758BB3E|nr:DDE-type integrase/transposase/recombinase [Burkholderia ubonensis]KVO85277.1 integrase [Burkholderia ubonensis]